MKVGNIVRSYDFPGNTTCYMVGEVVNVGKHHFDALTIKQVFEGKEIKKFSPTFRAPLQGEGMFDDKFERVVILD